VVVGTRRSRVASLSCRQQTRLSRVAIAIGMEVKGRAKGFASAPGSAGPRGADKAEAGWDQPQRPRRAELRSDETN
jgi:hypothetical protein